MDASSPIISIHIDMGELTKSSTIYFDLIRRIAFIFQVIICRNEYDIGEGIWVIGREQIVRACEKYLTQAIERIESNVDNITGQNMRTNMNKGLTEVQIRANRRTKLHQIWLGALNGLNVRQILKETYPREIFEGIGTKLITDLWAINTYKEQTPSLRVKKPFQWKLT